MVLEAFWGSFWGLLGVCWGLSGASRSTKRGLQLRLVTPLGLVCSLLAAEDGLGRVLGPSLARFGCSRGPLKGSQTDLPTLKNGTLGSLILAWGAALSKTELPLKPHRHSKPPQRHSTPPQRQSPTTHRHSATARRHSATERRHRTAPQRHSKEP